MKCSLDTFTLIVSFALDRKRFQGFLKRKKKCKANQLHGYWLMMFVSDVYLPAQYPSNTTQFNQNMHYQLNKRQFFFSLYFSIRVDRKIVSNKFFLFEETFQIYTR